LEGEETDMAEGMELAGEGEGAGKRKETIESAGAM
jgi:hypothetical protein